MMNGENMKEMLEPVFSDEHRQNVSNESAISTTMSFLDKAFLPQSFPPEVKVIFSVAYGLIIGCAVSGNAMVILVICLKRRMRNVTNIFFVSLATSDILIAVWNMPLQLHFYIRNEWTLGEFVCKLFSYIQGVNVVASIFTLMAIAIDRYYAICHPFEARHIHTVKRATVIQATIWGVALVAVSPQLSIQRLEPRISIQGHAGEPCLRMAMVCAEYFAHHYLNLVYTWGIFIAVYLVPMLVTFTAYKKIASRLWLRRPVGDAEEDALHHERGVQQKRKIISMLVVVATLFAACWLPFFSVQLYSLHRGAGDRLRLLMAVFHLVGYSNSCFNPVVYGLMNENFRESLYLVVCHRDRRRLLRRSTISATLETAV